MLKKALGLVIAVVMLLGVFGLTACNNDTLGAYKTAGKTAIDTYAQERKDNYCEDNWTVVCGIVEGGKQAVDVAENKSAVDTAVERAKKDIDEVEKINAEATDQIQNGAYFATENSNSFVLVKGNLMTFNEVFEPSAFCAASIVSDTFEIALADGKYFGDNSRKTISFKLLGNELIVDIDYGWVTKRIKFLRDATVTLSSENPLQLSPPQDIEINNVDLRWYPTEFFGQYDGSTALLNKAGVLGLGFEIKLAGKQDFELIGIRDYYPEPDCFYYLYFPHLNLPQGTNIVKVFCVGGLFLQDGKVRESISSESVYFSVTVNTQGEFIIQKNN